MVSVPCPDDKMGCITMHLWCPKCAPAAPAPAAEVRRLRAEIEKAGQLAEVVNDVADRLDRRWQSETFNGDEDARRLRTALAGGK